MNLEELKKACDENLTVINSDPISKEIKILFVGETKAVAREIGSGTEYFVDVRSSAVREWKLKPITKKYYLWKFKTEVNSPLEVTACFYDNECKNTKGKVYLDLSLAKYKEKIESTMHEE